MEKDELSIGYRSIIFSVRYLLTHYGITQKELAFVLFIDPSNLSRILNLENIPSGDLLIRIIYTVNSLVLKRGCKDKVSIFNYD